jgi:Mg/Co/Ni transporter MgtE
MGTLDEALQRMRIEHRKETGVAIVVGVALAAGLYLGIPWWWVGLGVGALTAGLRMMIGLKVTWW